MCQYTPAIDIWSIGCIFAEILTGKPLFLGKSVIHQLDLITELLGTPSLETISGVRNEKARKCLGEMRKKPPVPFTQKFPKADPLALHLLRRLLAFDPKDRPTAEEALADPYFKGLAKVDREHSCQPISKLEFEFEKRRVIKEDIREILEYHPQLIYWEILEYHPQLLKDYMYGAEGTSFLYPSAIGQFKKQFAYLEENSGKNGPVIPPARKHVSLPRSTIHSSTVPPNAQPIYVSYENREAEEASSSFRVTDTSSGSVSKVSRPPPRVPTAKPGRVFGPVLPYDNARNIKETYDPRVFDRNGVHPPQPVSPHCVFRTQTANQEKPGFEMRRDASHGKLQPQPQQHEQRNLAVKPASGMGMGMEVNTNPYYQPPTKVDQLNMIDSKLMQAQSQFGPVGAAAVAVAARRNTGAVQYGLS